MGATPTPEEIDRHQRAIVKLRNHLFKEYAPERFFIVAGSEVVLPIKVSERPIEVNGPLVRDVLLGGLEYEVKSPQPGKRYQLTMEHWFRDSFALWLRYEWPGHMPESLGRSSITCHFREIPSTARQMITVARYEDFEAMLVSSQSEVIPSR